MKDCIVFSFPFTNPTYSLKVLSSAYLFTNSFKGSPFAPKLLSIYLTFARLIYFLSSVDFKTLIKIDIKFLAPSLQILSSALFPLSPEELIKISLTISILIESLAYSRGLYLIDSSKFLGSKTYIL